LSIAAGWAAAFTTVGAWLIYMGSALLIAAGVLWPRRKRVLWAVTLIFIFAFPPWLWLWQPLIPIVFWTALALVVRATRRRDGKLSLKTD